MNFLSSIRPWKALLFGGLMLVLCIRPALSQNVITWSTQLHSNNQYCPANSPISLNVQGTNVVGAGNNCPNDSVSLSIFWGDGESDTFAISYTGTYYYCYFDTSISHIYNVPGDFAIKCYLLHPNYFDSIRLTDTFRLRSVCCEVSGNVYSDANFNCSLDTGEIPLTYVSLTAFDQNHNPRSIGFTNSQGYFEMSLPFDSSSYYIIPTSIGYDSTYCPNNYFPFIADGDTNHSFYFQCINDLNLRARHGFSGVGSPGQTGFLTFRIHAETCDSITATARLIIDTSLVFENILIGPSPDSISGNKFFWFIDIPPNSSQALQMPLKVRMKVRTKTTATIGNDVTLKASVFSSSNELIINDNHDVWDLEIGGPYDPNNKIVSPQGIGAIGGIDGSVRLSYLINFQNTGSDTARHVFVIDSLSAGLDHGSIQIVDSKHPMKVLYDNGILRFDFPNIQLPDSATDAEGSKGWFIFSVDPIPSILIGTEIKNHVDIYFDYNAPIRTNNTLNTIIASTPITADVEIVHNRCKFNDVAKANLNIAGGEPSYDVIWHDGLESTVRQSLATGNYGITVTDDGYQMWSDTVSVFQLDTIAPFISNIHFNQLPEVATTQWVRVDEQDSVEFTWQVVGGDVLDIEHNRVKILWSDTTSGQITVEAIDSTGCINNRQESVSISPLEVEHLTNTSWQVYPNPTSETIRIIGGSTPLKAITVFNQLGQPVSHFVSDSEATAYQLDLSSLNPGTYFIAIKTHEETQMTKIMLL